MTEYEFETTWGAVFSAKWRYIERERENLWAKIRKADFRAFKEAADTFLNMASSRPTVNAIAGMTWRNHRGDNNAKREGHGPEYNTLMEQIRGGDVRALHWSVKALDMACKVIADDIYVEDPTGPYVCERVVTERSLRDFAPTSAPPDVPTAQKREESGEDGVHASSAHVAGERQSGAGEIERSFEGPQPEIPDFKDVPDDDIPF